MKNTVCCNPIILFIMLFVVPPAFSAQVGFCKHFQIPQDTNQLVLTVPADQKFVLRKLYAFVGNSEDLFGKYRNWSLKIDETILLDGSIVIQSDTDKSFGGEIYHFVHDFPDGCVIVQANESLVAHTDDLSNWDLYITVIGYFTDASPYVSDLNEDGGVNLADLAILANEWLSGTS